MSDAMHVATIRKRHVDRAGQERVYESYLLRRSFREDGKVKHETLANLTPLPVAHIELLRRSLKGEVFVPADTARVTVERSLPHGDVALVMAQARALGLPALLGPAGRQRDLALALIVSRVVRPASKLATLGWWGDTTLGVDLDVADASTDEVYAAMDWLLGRQNSIELKLARRHLLDEATNPHRMALFDLSSSWVEGTHCELAARGYSRDGKKGKEQIEYGLLCDPAGRPVAMRVFVGNTGDPTAFKEAVTTVRDTFGLRNIVMVGDRGMITNARIDALRKLPAEDGFAWLTCLRAPQIAALAAEGGPLQMSLFDQQDLAEISHPDYPGERLVACRNPALAEQRARKRDDLLAATEQILAPILTAVAEGRLTGADKIGLKIGKVIDKYKMAKHFDVLITDTTLTITRRQANIDAEAALDGIYVIRTSVAADNLDAAGVVTAYKNLSHIERDWRNIKVDDLDLRPIYHRLADRVKAHLLVAMLAQYLIWHLRRAMAPLTYTDDDPPTRDNPVAPAQRTAAAARKASRQRDEHNQPYYSLRGLLTHLGTLTRNDIRYGTKDTDPVIPTLAVPTRAQRQAFELLGAPIPISLA
ncbi:MAG TPA: transposase [Acidimicrobiales bacterium]|nr:transposase [Acidimicrobiales bacterium]